MAGDKRAKEELEEIKKQLRAQFSNYENAVILISSLEAWFEYRWGDGGKEAPGNLVKFDRFPHCDSLTPDFLAFFKTPYVLCGECMKTFRRGRGAEDDVKQIVAYSRWRPESAEQEVAPGYDVLLILSTHSDDVAGQELSRAAARDPELIPQAPVVIVGYMRDDERVSGQWYDLKWRPQNNCCFTTPNVLPPEEGQDLNALITKAVHCAIPVDQAAVAISGRAPLINDCPPPFYTAVRILLPALNQLLAPDQQDVLRTGDTVQLTFTQEKLLDTEVLQSMSPPGEYVRTALAWLVQIGLAEKRVDANGEAYCININDRFINHTEDVLVAKAARRQLKQRGKKRDTRQTGLF